MERPIQGARRSSLELLATGVYPFGPASRSGSEAALSQAVTARSRGGECPETLGQALHPPAQPLDGPPQGFELLGVPPLYPRVVLRGQPPQGPHLVRHSSRPDGPPTHQGRTGPARTVWHQDELLALDLVEHEPPKCS